MGITRLRRTDRLARLNRARISTSDPTAILHSMRDVARSGDSTPKIESLIPAEEARQVLGGISPPTWSRLLASGEIATVKVGRLRVMVEPDELRRYIDRQRRRRVPKDDDRAG